MTTLSLVDETDSPKTRSRILVVDDVEANLTAIEAALAPIECRLVTARSGNDALARLLEDDFALVLLDVQMPIMDGYETAHWIRTRDRTRHVPIIFLTAHDRDDEAVRRAYHLGAVDFLFKPLDVVALRAKVQVFISLHERTLEVARLQAQRMLDEQRKQLEAAALRSEMHQLAVADERKNEFLAILAHELRNPLAPIRTSLELIRDGDPIPPTRLLDIMDRQLTHVTRLVDDLLDVSRIAAGKTELNKEPTKLSSVVDRALADSRPAIDARRHRVTLDGSEDPLVDADATRLIQVVTNLLTNSARYTEPSGDISIAWGRVEDRAFLRVRDSGVGIEPSALDRVFDMFVQEGHPARGLGVGLALAKKLVELHGGTISVTSEGRNKGSTFEVRLPLALGSVEQIGTTTKRFRKESPPKRAVVIDDNTDICELTAALLASRGHQVLTAFDGQSALSLIEEHRPDVALVDLGLPGLDGYELIKQVRQRCPDLGTRFVAMTGFGQENDLARTRDAGFHAHLLKPARSTAILDAIEEE